MEIRTASGTDAEALERIRVRGWQAAYRRVFPPDELDRMEVDATRWRKHLDAPPPGHACFVAERGGRLLGFAALGPCVDEPAAGELFGLYVDPREWSTGAGRALIERAEERLALEHAEAILWVLEANPRARLFYERAGWRADGGRREFVRLGVSAPVVRYRKLLTSSRSRS